MYCTAVWHWLAALREGWKMEVFVVGYAAELCRRMMVLIGLERDCEREMVAYV
jgi:hypothetical protein